MPDSTVTQLPGNDVKAIKTCKAKKYWIKLYKIIRHSKYHIYCHCKPSDKTQWKTTYKFTYKTWHIVRDWKYCLMTEALNYMTLLPEVTWQHSTHPQSPQPNPRYPRWSVSSQHWLKSCRTEPGSETMSVYSHPRAKQQMPHTLR